MRALTVICSCAILFILLGTSGHAADIDELSALRRIHFGKIAADGCHSPTWSEEKALDGDPETGWFTVQKDTGGGWGVHWLELTLRRPQSIHAIRLLGAISAYSSSTWKDCTYAIKLMVGDNWQEIGEPQTVPAGLEHDTTDVIWTLPEPLTATAVRCEVKWEAEQESIAEDEREQLRYAGVRELQVLTDTLLIHSLDLPDEFTMEWPTLHILLSGDGTDAEDLKLRVAIRDLWRHRDLPTVQVPMERAEAAIDLAGMDLPTPHLANYQVKVTLLAGDTLQDEVSTILRGHGRILTSADIAKPGFDPQPGDEIILTDMGLIQPQEAVSTTEQKGLWRLLPYTTDDGQAGDILCVTARDPENPESCLVPTVRVPLNLEGEYEIWVVQPRTYRAAGADVKLSRDETFTCVTPGEFSRYDGPYSYEKDCLVETFWKVADLSGQELEIRQPYGTYLSDPWGFCEAWFAGVRLVKLSRSDVAQHRRQWQRRAVKRVIYNHDGHGVFWHYDPRTKEDLWRIVDVFRDQSVHHLDWCVIAGGAFNHFTEVGEMFGDDLPDEAAPRLGDKRIAACLQRFKQQGIDPLQVIVERGKQVGVPIYASYRMDPFYGAPYARMFNGPFWREHPELRIPGGNHLDYAHPETREYVLSVFRELLENYDLDGVNMDFTRHPPFFRGDDPDKFQYMTEFVRALRQEVDRMSTQRGMKIALSATFHGSTHERDGLDVATWVKDGLVDEIAPQLVVFSQTTMQGPKPFADMVRGTDCELFVRVENTMGGHDPTPAENLKDMPVREHRGPKDYEQIMLDATQVGAKGVYIFNNYFGWLSLRRMGFLDELDDLRAQPSGYGIHEGATIKMAPKEAKVRVRYVKPDCPDNRTGGLVAKYPDGRVILLYTTGGIYEPFGTTKIMAVISEDGGWTWSEPQLAVHREDANACGGTPLVLRDGSLYVFYMRFINSAWTEDRAVDREKTHSDVGCVLSRDGSLNFTEDNLLLDGYCGATNGAIETAEGNIVVPLSYIADDVDVLVSAAWVSTDGGKTFTKSNELRTGDTPGSHRGAIEPTAVELSDGRLLMLIRTQLGWQYESFSEDGGLTWTKPRQSGIESPNAPAWLLRLQDGRIVCCHNIKDRGTLYLSITGDDARTWEALGPIVTGSGVCYPSIAEVEPNELLVTWVESWKVDAARVTLPPKA